VINTNIISGDTLLILQARTNIDINAIKVITEIARYAVWKSTKVKGINMMLVNGGYKLFPT
jgi:hypothetical protein